MTAQDRGIHFEVTIDVTIRKLVRDDLPKLEWYGQYTHFRRLFKYSFRKQALGSRLMLVADMNDFPIGRLFIQLNSPSGEMADGRTKAYLYSFTVMDMFQGHGIGTRLMDTAEALLIRRKFREATIAVAKNNVGALRLYERRGYTTYEESDGHWRYRDHRGIMRHVYEPAWLLAKTLTSV